MNNDTPVTTIGSAERQITFTPGKAEYLRLNLNNQPVLFLEAAVLDQFTECGSLLQKACRHQTLDGVVARFETTMQIPFGTEPEIRRSVELVDGFSRIIDDYQPGGGVAFGHLKLGDIALPGPWKNIVIIPIPEAGKPAYTHFTRLQASDENAVFYNAAEPFLCAIFERDDGLTLEIGCGDDLWRWQVADGLENCDARFKISGNRQHIVLERMPLAFHEEAAPKCASRRFKWYFAWESPEDAAVPVTHPDGFAFDLKKLDLPDSAAKTDGGKKSGGDWCLEAAATRRRLRKKLRALLANQDAGDVTLNNVEPHVCANAAHLGRPAKQKLLHWDAWDLMELFIWANRKLANTDRFFGIEAPGNAAATATPLMKRFRRRGFNLFPPETE